MKIVSKILLIVLLLLGLSLPLASDRAYAMAQITMVNRSQLTLNLYIDGNFGCGPVLGVGHFTNSPGLFCTSSVTPGPHRLEARDREKVWAHEDDVNIGDGTSPTWTVTIEDPDQALMKKLDGAKYINQRAWPKIRAEYELDIRGATLVWRMRFTWATPEIVDARVGTWREIDQVQIVGREAHSSQQSDVIFSISEDGNNITEKNGSDTYMYYRQ
jgi:hypothetical protein